MKAAGHLKPWLEPWQAKKYAGNACIGLGLMSAFSSFGLFITRKNNGETALKWLGSDDFFVMSSMMVGGLLMAWCGKAALLSGVLEDNEKNAPAMWATRTSAHTPLLQPSSGKTEHSLAEQYMQTAYRTAIAASIVFFTMSFYALLGGLNHTPTPDSHIGPHDNNNMELSVYCLLYGLTGLLSMASLVVTAGKASYYASLKAK